MRTDKLHSAFLLTALLIPTLEASAGSNWLPTLIAVLASALLTLSLQGGDYEVPGWLGVLRYGMRILLIACFLPKTHTPWPGNGSAYVVPAVLLALAVLASGGEKSMRACNVLRYGMYLALLLLGISGLRSIRLPGPIAEYPEGELMLVLSLPLMTQKRNALSVLPLAALAMSILTAYSGAESLYDYSRGVTLAGVSSYVESIAACAGTIGWFALLCYLLPEKGRAWAAAAAFGCSLVLRVDPWLLVAGVLIFWGIPAFLLAEKRERKREIRG